MVAVKHEVESLDEEDLNHLQGVLGEEGVESKLLIPGEQHYDQDMTHQVVNEGEIEVSVKWQKQVCYQYSFLFMYHLINFSNE